MHAEGVAAHEHGLKSHRPQLKLRHELALVCSRGAGFHLQWAVMARVEGELAYVKEVWDEPFVQRAAQRA